MKPLFLIIIYLFIGKLSFTQQSDIIFEKGLNLYRKGDFKGADSLINISLYIDRKNKVFDYLKYYNKGAVQYKLNNFEIAIKYLDSSLVLKNDFYPTIEKKAWCKLGLKDYQGALSDVDLVISIAPRYLESYSFGAHVSLYAEDFERAERYCLEGLKNKQ